MSTEREVLVEDLDNRSLSLCGKGSLIYVDPDTRQTIVVPTRCHRWDCPRCSRVRYWAAVDRARAGKPQRQITLTLRGPRKEQLSQQVDYIRKRWVLLAQRIRRTHGPFEWMASLELHKNGTPHLHILTRGSYISQRWLSNAWLRLTGSFKVHIKKVDRVSRAVDELTKYMLKSAAQLQIECPGRPLVTMSRNWLPPDYDQSTKTSCPDPVATFFPVHTADVLHVALLLGAKVGCDASNPRFFAVTFARPPTIAELDLLPLLVDSAEYAAGMQLVYNNNPDAGLRSRIKEQLSAYHNIQTRPLGADRPDPHSYPPGTPDCLIHPLADAPIEDLPAYPHPW